MVTKKKQTKKPKEKIVYRTKKVYVEKKSEDSAMKETRNMIGLGMGAMIGAGVIGAMGNMLRPR
jgi:hypothetical protein